MPAPHTLRAAVLGLALSGMILATSAGMVGRLPESCTDQLSIVDGGRRATVDIVSPRGIGRGVLVRSGLEWPAEVVIRYHLKGLAHASLSDGRQTVRVEIPSSAPSRLICEYRSTPQETFHSVEGLDAWRVSVRPVKDGVYELTVPAVLLDGNPARIALRWIDFYR